MSESNIADRLMTLRGAQAWSQQDLAEASGVSARTIQRLEAGAKPSLETARALAAAFDLEPTDLVTACPRSSSPTGNATRGARWGIVGALTGYGCAFAAVTHSLAAGQTTGWHAGVTLGTLGAATGLLCGAIGWLSRRGVRAA